VQQRACVHIYARYPPPGHGPPRAADSRAAAVRPRAVLESAGRAGWGDPGAPAIAGRRRNREIDNEIDEIFK